MHPLPSAPSPGDDDEHPGASAPRDAGELISGARDLGRPCRCGHGRVVHEHYRAGSDCSLCECERFRRVRRWWPGTVDR
jgi:hypothetical protein